MKYLILELLALLTLGALATWSPAVRAEHGSPLLLVKPGDGSTIPRNAQIRLVSYNGEDELIWLLGHSPRKVRARLVAGDSKVRLRPGRYFTDHDGYGRAMIALVPARLLAPSTTYRLVVDVPSAGWSDQLASFVTAAAVDRAPPRWRSPPVHEAAGNTLVGRLAAYDDLIELEVIARHRAGGRARRTFVLFDLSQKCIEGPTADYRVAIFNSQCLDEQDQPRPDAICDTLYYFTGWRELTARYVVRLVVRDLAGNARRLGRSSGVVGLEEPLGLCLEREPAG